MDSTADSRTFEMYFIRRYGDNHSRYVLLDSRGSIYSGAQLRSPEIVAGLTPTELARLPRIPMDASRYFPSMDEDSITVYIGPPDASIYVKKQALFASIPDNQREPEWYREMMTRELHMAEMLRQHPHPNVCEYRGAVVHPVSHLVVGLAYKKHTLDLNEFVREKRLVNGTQIYNIMDKLNAGIAHMHKLGIVHCDVRPPNIFLTLGQPSSPREEGINMEAAIEEVVIGDFDASVKVGEMIDRKIVAKDFRHEDYDFGSTAAYGIDTFALEKVADWLWEHVLDT
jgi:serine/threonine protein kinase